MKGQSGELDAYRQFSAAGRRWRTYPLYEVTCTLRGFLPLSRTGFERRLDGALGEAGRRGRGFYIAGFAARRALGSALVIDIDPGVLREKLQVEFMEGEQVRLVRDKFLGAGEWSTPQDDQALLHLSRSRGNHKIRLRLSSGSSLP